MKYNPDIHHRRSIRLQGYDYSSPGAYFVTMCTHNRECLFGEIANGKMRLNELGKIASQCWLAIPDHFPHARLGAFVIMPNHVHGIIWIVDNIVGAKNFSPLQSLSGPLSADSKLALPNGPGNTSTCTPFGNAIITNTSYAMKPN